MNNSWHPDCFCCDICQAVLADVGFVKNAGRWVCRILVLIRWPCDSLWNGWLHSYLAADAPSFALWQIGTCVALVITARRPVAWASTSARSATPSSKSIPWSLRMTPITRTTSTATTAGQPPLSHSDCQAQDAMQTSECIRDITKNGLRCVLMAHRKELTAEARELKGELYCLPCHDKMGVPICGACRRPIEGRVVNAMGKQWHVEVCQKEGGYFWCTVNTQYC